MDGRMQTLYEVHAYHRGNWQIDSIYDDRDLAIYEAHVLERNGRCTAVRVVKESYDPDRNFATAHVVYKSSRSDSGSGFGSVGKRSSSHPVANHPTPPPTPPPPRPMVMRPVRGETAEGEPTRWYVMLALKAGGLLLVGLVVIIALKKLAELI